MHISEGILSAPVLLTGAALAVAGVAVGLKRLPPERMPQAAILSSAFFVASLVHVPVGFTSAHLILNGLLGAISAGPPSRPSSWPCCSRPCSSNSAA